MDCIASQRRHQMLSVPSRDPRCFCTQGHGGVGGGGGALILKLYGDVRS